MVMTSFVSRDMLPRRWLLYCSKFHILQVAQLCTGRAGACVVHLRTSWLAEPHLAYPGITESEYHLLLTHGWFAARCHCEHQQPQQNKKYKTTSTSTDPTSTANRNSTCLNCDVSRRTAPPGHLRVTGIVRTPRPVSDVCSHAARSVGDLSVSADSGRPVTASTSIDLIDLSSDPSEIYVNFNPGYKSMTPPDDVVKYTMPSPPVLESAPASLTSLRQAGSQQDVVPPRSLTAPNVRGLDELGDNGNDLWQPRSPRASWAGPQTYRDSPEFHVYDEVYIPRVPSPPPMRSSSLQNSPLSHPATRLRCRHQSSGLARPVSHIPVPSSSSDTSAGLERRSASFQAVCSSRGVPGSASPSPSPNPSPTTSYIKQSRRQSKDSPSPPKNYVEVWIPQIAHRQSASFAGLTPKEEQKHQSRLSQSCEQMEESRMAALKRSKRRCPTPPRVLSPTGSESLKCEIIADI